MLVQDFDYHLPKELIAQKPIEPRDASRLLVVNRKTGEFFDQKFYEIGNWLKSGDLLVLNNTRVIPARIFGKLPGGGKVEFLLLRQLESGIWEILTRPARKTKPGTVVKFNGYTAIIIERKSEGIRVVRFEPENIYSLLSTHGELALPPYIKARLETPERYQTIFARVAGAVAAPTAGLHFTQELFDCLSATGIQFVNITLHAGLGTFRPIKTETVEDHKMHPEEFEITAETAALLNQALKEHRRIVCVGTTTVRVLESQAERVNDRVLIKPGRGQTNLYIYPGYDWKVTDILITNFHLPKSTLLLLVCAFANRDLIMRAYQYAIEQRYRFYSFGDAMLII
uniref:S-adenosylmethionine:tRNA ribosyltransferase-isomerase n=1 Tax=candidate division WOR-3 bacterium TaxID=2052148 RepID=A0A7V3UYX3_UNCW3